MKMAETIIGTLTEVTTDGLSKQNLRLAEQHLTGNYKCNNRCLEYYTRYRNFNGTDTFTVTITDDDGHAETQDITVTVNAVNDAATFRQHQGSGNEDGGAIIGTLTASEDADGLSMNYC